MVDFKKRLTTATVEHPLDPLEIYEKADRESDKGPLRPAQDVILKEWHGSRRGERDLIVKLHTGQGKTLIGLLMLRSKLNEDKGPALYLCPNNFLVNQTIVQAKQFGIPAVMAEPDLPASFLDGKDVLVTSVQKLFNGFSKFGVGAQYTKVGSVVMDDAHACIDAIREAFIFCLERGSEPYNRIIDLFAPSLEQQGAGTFINIREGNDDAISAVPYWEWRERAGDVAAILAANKGLDEIKFVWPLLKDNLADCLCVVSGGSIEIAPYIPPLHLFGSYAKAGHRVFMSATVTNDAFLVKGLGLSTDVVKNPLSFKNEKWSGEKMVLIPSLIDESLTREAIVEKFAKPVPKRRIGVVALTPSFYRSQDWKAYGSTVATKQTIEQEVERLKQGGCENALVMVNRYDGIDLPDSSCRLLILDSKPHGQTLHDQYAENCRGLSEAIATRTARIIEQGMGRSVRGEKDYCAILLIGANLVRSLRTKQSRGFFSSQTRMQIEIGIEIAEFVQEDKAAAADSMSALIKVINQCLKRDADWKEFYSQRMDRIAPEAMDTGILELFQAEKEAEALFVAGKGEGAAEAIQKLIDSRISDPSERGWYLQEMARYIYPHSKQRSNELQVEAHRMNRYLLKPVTGMAFTPISMVGQKRVGNLIGFIQRFDDYEELQLCVDEVLSSLRFGVKADAFERALDDLARMLGFSGERPDKQWKEGPDNLWGVRDAEYLLFEAKSEVSAQRAEINKTETGQMNNAIAWFERHYKGGRSKNIIIIPTKTVSKAGGFSKGVEIMREKQLQNLTKAVRGFFLEFKNKEFKDLSDEGVQKLLDVHCLNTDSLLSAYSEAPKFL